MGLSELGTSSGASVKKATQGLGSLVLGAVPRSEFWVCPGKLVEHQEAPR